MLNHAASVRRVGHVGKKKAAGRDNPPPISSREETPEGRPDSQSVTRSCSPALCALSSATQAPVASWQARRLCRQPIAYIRCGKALDALGCGSAFLRLVSVAAFRPIGRLLKPKGFLVIVFHALSMVITRLDRFDFKVMLALQSRVDSARLKFAVDMVMIAQD